MTPPLLIVAVRWTRAVNVFRIRCTCGREHDHRADRWRVTCPACRRTAPNVHKVPERLGAGMAEGLFG